MRHCLAENVEIASGLCFNFGYILTECNQQINYHPVPCILRMCRISQKRLIAQNIGR